MCGSLNIERLPPMRMNIDAAYVLEITDLKIVSSP